MSQPVQVLLIEDNEQNAYLATFLLEQAGMQVERAKDGTEGLRLARQQTPQVILVDIQLPDIDGYEIATALRQDRSFDRVCVIALTSFAMPAEKQRALKLGCNGYIEKPIAPLTFAEQVRSFIPAS